MRLPATDRPGRSNPVGCFAGIRGFIALATLATVFVVAGGAAQAAPPIPNLVGPTNGLNVHGTVIPFDWSQSSGATNYWIQVARQYDPGTGALSDFFFDEPIGNYIGIDISGALDNGQQYWWRVSAGNATGWSDFSVTWTFWNGPGGLATTPVLTSPGNGASVSGTTIQFRWSSTYALDYYLVIAYDPDFTIFAFQDWTNSSYPGLDLIDLPQNGQTYYWYVYAWNVFGLSQSSTVRSVTNTAHARPPTVTLLSPGNGTNVSGGEISFRWNRAAYALYYYIILALDPGFTNIAYEDWWWDYPGADLIEFLDNGQPYYWKVIAWNPLGYSPSYSSTWTFTNGPSGPPFVPDQISPVSGSNVPGTTIEFRWDVGYRALDYYIQIARDAGFSNISFQGFTNGVLGYDHTGLADDGQTYYWKVRATNPAGSSSYSSTWTVVNGPSAVPAAPTLASPANGSVVSGSLIQFRWNQAARAAEYIIEVALDSGFSLPIYSQSAGANLGADVGGFPNDDVTYYWRVRAKNPLGTTDSPTWTVVNGIGACAARTGTGNGLLSFQVHVDTCFTNAMYHLVDISRRASTPADHTHFGRMPDSSSIRTKIYVSPTAADLMTDPDNFWSSSTQSAGVDAHVYAGWTYDFLNLTYGLNSFDGAGATWKSLVEVTANQPNAFWDDSMSQVIFWRDTVGGTLPFSGALDAVAHEWGHAVTWRASGRPWLQIPWQPGVYTRSLFYGYESGALNEAFSDWLGTAVENAHGEHNWTIGEGILTLRDMQNPKSAPYFQPDTYNGQYYVPPGNCTPPANDSCGVHTNSGVPNKMFFLLSDGGTHNSVAVQGIGISNAMAIAVKANLEQWPNDATFHVARDGMELAAEQLFPGDPNMKYQVQNAWTAVGVGLLPVISLSAAPPEGGTVSGGGSYTYGTSVNVDALANTGYRFVNWTDSAGEASTSTSYTFTVNGDRHLTANFVLVAPDILVTPATQDFGHYIVGQTSPAQSFTVTNRGNDPLLMGSNFLSGGDVNQFAKTLDTCSGAAVAVNGTCEIRVQFAPTSTGLKQSTLYIQSNDPDSPFLGVPVSGTGDAPPTFTITASAGIGGTIDPSGTITVPAHGSSTFAIAPALGYYTLNVHVDGGAQGAISSYTFSDVMANHTISATFAVLEYTVTATSAGGGTITPAGTTTVLYGGNLTFTISPSAGNSIRDVRLDGVSVGAVASYTLTNIVANHTITASFSSPLFVGKSGTGTGTITSNPAGIDCGADCTEAYLYGTVVTLTATAAPGSLFVGWSGGVCTGTGDCVISMTTNTAATALFNVLAPDILVIPTSINFGTYSVGEVSTLRTIAVRNAGNSALSVGTVSITGANSSEFTKTADTCTAVSLPPNAICTIQLRFSPRSTGSKSASISIPSNDPDTPIRNVPLSGSSQTVVYTLVERPNSDAGPNYGGPVPFGPHYLNVDDDPHDGDATYLTFGSGGVKEVFTVADQLLDTDIVTNVKVRWVAKKGAGEEWLAKAGLVIGGQEYFGTTVPLPQVYFPQEDTFATNPATGQAWTVSDVRSANLIYEQVSIDMQLPRARLTEITLLVTIKRKPAPATVIERPNSDAGPNYGGPVPSGPHSLKVDDDPHDGDATYLTFASGGVKEVFTVADQLLDSDIVTNVKVRWVAKKGAGDEWLARVGLVLGGQEYFGTTVPLPQLYFPQEDTFATNPATGQAWTVSDVRSAKVIYEQVSIDMQLPRARLTEMVLLVTVERMPVPATVIELPGSDAGPNEGGPSPSGAHYLNVDDDPHDGDGTYLMFFSGGSEEVFTVADQLQDTDIIANVKVRWVAKKGSGDGWQGRAGLVLRASPGAPETEYYGPTEDLTESYTQYEVSFPGNPATGQPWTVADVRAAKLSYQQVMGVMELPRGRLTEIVLVVSIGRAP